MGNIEAIVKIADDREKAKEIACRVQRKRELNQDDRAFRDILQEEVDKVKNKELKKCEDCEDCIYICEGDFACMKNPPNIVITEFSIPTEKYGQCKEKATKDTDQSSPR